MKKILKKVNETGTLLVEAMAMLGLIAMVTPVLYKKASERTVELQDVNASAQMRALSTAIDSYLKDNFARITKGEKIANSAGNEVDYADFKNANDGQVGPVSITHFGDYLPYGFLNADGTPRETKLFDDDYNVVIKLESDVKDGKVLSQTLTGFVTATPKIPDEIGQVRASRIASMIGSNGGYVITEGTEQVAMGAQGIWSVPTSEFSGLTLADNSFVVSSVQPISSQGLANEDVLHRKNEPDAADELNTMETDLFMGYTDGDTRNIRLVNQIIMHPNVDRMVKGDDVASDRKEDIPADTLDPAGFSNTLDKALYIAKGGGAYVEGALQAMNSLFTVKEDGIKYYGTNSTSTTDPNTGETTTTTSRASEPTLKIDATELVYGDPGAGKAKLTVKSAGSMSFGTSAVPANGGTPAQAGVESLYADKTNFRAGDGNLNMTKDGADWYTVIKKDAAGNATAHEGGRSTYTWNGAVPTEDATEKTGKYEVSINGSAFVKDTMLTGKLKSFNVDAATLRAGVDPNEFDAAKNDTDFYTVTRRGSFIAGKDTIPMLTVSEDEYEDDEGRLIPEGVTIVTTDTNTLDGAAAGIDISAGNTGLIYYDVTRDDYVASDTPEKSIVRIAGVGGVNLSARNENGDLTEAPVSIQGEMFRAYKSGNYRTIDTYTQQFNMMSRWMWDNTSQQSFINGNFSYYRGGYSPSIWGRVYMADSSFILATTSGVPVVDIVPAVSPTGGVSSRFTGGLAIYDQGFDMRTHSDTGNITSPYTTQYGHNAYGSAATLYASRGIFQIRDYSKTYAADDPESLDGATNSYRSNKVKVFTISSTGVNTNLVKDSDRLSKNGSVYIRRGSMALESNVDEDNNRKLTNSMINTQYNNANDAVGYIAADRFISHYQTQNTKNLLKLTNKIDEPSANHRGTDPIPYEGYEVNPAYTSVMHDIKLTTRGGARLSDILPDFINKGIYLVDNSYDPGTSWKIGGTAPEPETYDLAYPGKPDVSMEQEVSEYAGFIPTPKCPPLYAKVATLTPSGWSMAQAGVPYDPTPANEGNRDVDVRQITNPNEYLKVVKGIVDGTKTFTDITPLTFQKNTWLRSMVLPCYSTGTDRCKFEETADKDNINFWGWGAIMGFIYPEEYYKEYTGGEAGTQNVYWNLFPVYYRQIEGYATVYCYFDRADTNYTDAEVDKDYDQLGAFNDGSINSFQKGDRGNGTTYLNRLNDPKLKYDDPW
ncbi:MAG: hypothetical protein IJZ59_06730 [Alphaproteobacteria bacterium]|nr:hypothetical protein [Alphaproteobacteria bacterium]